MIKKQPLKPQFLAVCRSYAKLKGISEQRAVIAGVLCWVRSFGDIPFSEFEDLQELLGDLKPFDGQFVKSADRKKTKGEKRSDDEHTCLTFANFWIQYNYKKSRAGAEEIFSKLTEGDRGRILAHLPGYIERTCITDEPGPFKPKRADPTTYLNDSKRKYWRSEDEKDFASRYQIPNGSKKSEAYSAYLSNWASYSYPGRENLLSYDEYDKIVSKKVTEFQVNQATVNDFLKRSHIKSAETGENVFNIFSQMLKNLNSDG